MTTIRRPILLALLAAAAAPAAPAQSPSRARVEKDERDRARETREAREAREARARAEEERRDREAHEARLLAERRRETRLRQERERQERERLERARLERERRLYAAQVQRERQLREARLERDRRDREARLERERRAREAAARARQQRQRWLDDGRPRVTLGGGIDVRQFDGDDDRYLVHGGVDFRGRGGLGMRPEVMFAWSDRGPAGLVVTGPTGQPIATTEPIGRTRALGVNLNATYTFLRTSPVRPYVLGGPGVLSTRTLVPQATVLVPQPGQTTTQLTTRTRHDLDLGLNTGAGLEFVLGPVRLFTEVRYFLTDSPPPRGFSGMVPITAGLRF